MHLLPSLIPAPPDVTALPSYPVPSLSTREWRDRDKAIERSHKHHVQTTPLSLPLHQHSLLVRLFTFQASPGKELPWYGRSVSTRIDASEPTTPWKLLWWASAWTKCILFFFLILYWPHLTLHLIQNAARLRHLSVILRVIQNAAIAAPHRFVSSRAITLLVPL